MKVNHKGKNVLRTVVRGLYSNMYGLQGVWRCLRKVRIEKSAHLCFFIDLYNGEKSQSCNLKNLEPINL